jgi:hypothetical protein
MDTDEALPLLPLVKGRYVGKAHERLSEALRWWLISHAVRRKLPKKPHRPVATARTEDRSDCRITESATQLSEPSGVVTREVAIPLKNSRFVFNAVAVRQDGETRVEGFSIEWTGGSYYRDRVARAKISRLVKNRLRFLLRWSVGECLQITHQRGTSPIELIQALRRIA